MDPGVNIDCSQIHEYRIFNTTARSGLNTSTTALTALLLFYKGGEGHVPQYENCNACVVKGSQKHCIFGTKADHYQRYYVI